jgi:hypothetical protein
MIVIVQMWLVHSFQLLLLKLGLTIKSDLAEQITLKSRNTLFVFNKSKASNGRPLSDQIPDCVFNTYRLSYNRQSYLRHPHSYAGVRFSWQAALLLVLYLWHFHVEVSFIKILVWIRCLLIKRLIHKIAL